ncbi:MULTISPECIES: helix-turn-helix domain-containing protein [Sphingomonas]|uniref:Helix-turn-helix transcriptional regulator n=1 Tax=Sphingomonas kyungheensis TaxID=1069987 RepID=A0ABU8H5T2_9SPHN|nr:MULTISPECIES: helix-turn-helix transcriptional regulator [unclassified Sphingomonas]EZP48707.1 Helix-turn-helix protein [Sphingomonas sp. RIT328]
MTRTSIAGPEEEVAAQQVAADDGAIDRYRSIVFPNAIRELRKQHGFARLLGLSAALPDIPYVRLSKIERGEVFAKPAELQRIATALRVPAEDLLLDIDAPGFDVADWATELQGWTEEEIAEDRFAVLLAAAIRARRDADRSLSIPQVERQFGIAPVILSRLENGYKPLSRWNAQTVRAICGLLGVADAAALRRMVEEADAAGQLRDWLPVAASRAARIEKTRARIALLRTELRDAPPPGPRAKAAHPFRIVPREPQPRDGDAAVLAAIERDDVATVRLVPVFGAPRGDGLIERVTAGRSVEAPRHAGEKAYGLRVCRATLGPALPAHAVVVVDPDRFPSSGGLACVREADGLRLLVVTFDRQGRMIGYSLNPEREIELDRLDPADIGSVVAVLLD